MKLELKEKGGAHCIQCVLARISRVVVTLFMPWPTVGLHNTIPADLWL